MMLEYVTVVRCRPRRFMRSRRSRAAAHSPACPTVEMAMLKQTVSGSMPGLLSSSLRRSRASRHAEGPHAPMAAPYDLAPGRTFASRISRSNCFARAASPLGHAESSVLYTTSLGLTPARRMASKSCRATLLIPLLAHAEMAPE